MNEELNKDKIIEEYKIKEKKAKTEKRVLILIIIILIIVYLVSFRIGVIEDLGGIKTDYNEENSEVIENTNQVDKEYIDKDYTATENKPLNSNPGTNQGENASNNKSDSENNTEEDIDNIKLVKVSWNGKEVTKNTKLDIFKNEKFNGQKIIAPGSKGSATFCIENTSNSEMICNLKFTEETKNPINMKYRLKIDNNYVVGNANKYEDLEKLNLQDILMYEKSINMYTIEWYWEDSDKEDTEVATQNENQYYTLNFEITAEEYIK